VALSMGTDVLIIAAPITQNFTMRTSFVPVVSAKEGTSDGRDYITTE